MPNKSSVEKIRCRVKRVGAFARSRHSTCDGATIRKSSVHAVFNVSILQKYTPDPTRGGLGRACG